ncbi:hypothetical protein BD410DRAFT_815247 [Rickenella mellea]|uniref:ERCC4 domain-containing protein n=1 Tax=Rickenella mellea TaxID=50990 RepID=A0A4Y7Q2F3_9AGAM|nr:hypothetical protein BD410DRAFT_815247 [Rickenella mellea]
MTTNAGEPLLQFQRSILETIHDPSNSDLTVLARGLGLRKIVCTLLKIYDGPQNLVLLVNATSEEEASIGEDLGVMGCRKPGLRVVSYEMGKKDRQSLYKQGGLISVTSRILVVDMLQSDIPTELITGLIVLHAERVTALSLEAFIIRLFREKNQAGFVKAFTDQPEHITSGLSPLKAIMKELQLRKVHIYPRFHEDVKESLERRKADVIELYQPMSESMSDIHQAIVQCMSTTLAELKRSNTNLDLDDFSVENAYFRSFDAIVRRQLDPVWHKVGPKTKQLVSDLATLRRLLTYLLTYDSLAFHAYLETIVASNSTSASGAPRQNQSPWLFMDAANTIFQTAKRRCYLSTSLSRGNGSATAPHPVDDDDDAWEALDEIHGTVGEAASSSAEQASKRKKWLPDGMDPVLEELPKWSLLADVLKEIEEEMMRREGVMSVKCEDSPGTNTVLIMCSSTRTSDGLVEFLSTMTPSAARGSQGRTMMERRLRLYLWWKGKLARNKKDGKPTFHMPQVKNSEDVRFGPGEGNEDAGVSEALKKKDEVRLQRAANRRRIRGGAPAAGTQKGSAVMQDNGMSGREREKLGLLAGEGDMMIEADSIADFLASQKDAIYIDDDTPLLMLADEDVTGAIPSPTPASLAAAAVWDDPDFDPNYGLLSPEQTIVIRAYSDDADDLVLSEIQPRFIVMFEPNHDFIRRIECYRSSNPGLGVRVYFMVYHLSCEEHKYLAGLRREKDSFERLIKEKGSMLLPILDQPGRTGDALIKTISTRIAGGKEASVEPSQVIVDMREFRSTLPSLLHASRVLVIPATLTVGDYILTPEICVERKSLPDLAQSFNSGRLYTQCELMSVHYKQPVLLIEFEEHKSFSLEIMSDAKSYVKPTGKYPAKKRPQDTEPSTISIASIQSKLVLLTLTFPRLRIIWSSSPYASAEIFNDLKLNNSEPDPAQAVAIGADEDPNVGAGVNASAEELLRVLPGVTVKNVKYVMNRVGSVRALCELELKDVQDILGVEPGKACWEFLHRGETRSSSH